MSVNAAGLVGGVVFGFVLSWSRVTDPAVIRDMLRLREPDVFLLMGSAIVVAALGIRLLRAIGARAAMTGDPIAWSVQRPERRHVLGSMMFGAGWSVAGTCPGPVAAMIGEGRLSGLIVAGGLIAGIALHHLVVSDTKAQPSSPPNPVGL